MKIEKRLFKKHAVVLVTVVMFCLLVTNGRASDSVRVHETFVYGPAYYDYDDAWAVHVSITLTSTSGRYYVLLSNGSYLDTGNGLEFDLTGLPDLSQRMRDGYPGYLQVSVVGVLKIVPTSVSPTGTIPAFGTGIASITASIQQADFTQTTVHSTMNVTISDVPAPDPNRTTPFDPKVLCPGSSSAMARYNVHASLVSLNIEDTPITRIRPVGPGMDFKVTYNQLEANQPATFDYSNLGPLWTCNWISYVTCDPTNANTPTNIYDRGGGTETFTWPDGDTDFAGSSVTCPVSNSILTRSEDSNYFQREFPDGSVEVFAAPDNSNVYPHRVFLTEVRDRYGNSIHVNYVANTFQIASVSDGDQKLDFSYELSGDSWKITKVTDNSTGRFATFSYDSSNRLIQSTDVMQISSQYAYTGTTNSINALTTPYGTTTFITGTSPGRYIEITDPNNSKERIEYEASISALSDIDSAAPQGVANDHLSTINTFYWDRKAMLACSGTDYTKARVTHWLWSSDGTTVSSTPACLKQSLENRVWFLYAGQTDPYRLGINPSPNFVSRIMDDGSQQTSTYSYNAHGKLTGSTDPIGRTTALTYAANNIDLLSVSQAVGGNPQQLMGATYNGVHSPLSVTDAAGQTTTFTYNGYGQVLTLTDPKSETTTFAYAVGSQDLTSITDPTGASTTLQYDNADRVQSVTDSQNYTLTYQYDALNRRTGVTYPDGTSDQVVYNILDVGSKTDRIGRTTTYNYDALEHLTSVVDPLNRTTTFTWCDCGALVGLTDANGNTTRWTRDLEERVTAKTFIDNSSVQYTYENTTSRLKSSLDAKGQQANYSYNLDDTISQISYSGGVATPSVGFTYDPNFRRILTGTDGVGITTYTYNAIGSLGAERVASISGPLPNSTVTYGYDELGRIVSRSINGTANASSFQFDSLGRVTSATNPLGTFAYGYVGATGRVNSITYPNSQSTAFSYLPNNGDDRLQEIKNLDPNGGMMSQFNYAYNAVGNITFWSQNNSGLANAHQFALGYDAADQLVSAVLNTGSSTKPYSYAYDPAGNRTTAQVNTAIHTASYNYVNELMSGTSGGLMKFAGTLSEPGTVTVAGSSASVDSNLNFSGYANVTSGSNIVPIVATSNTGVTSTNSYLVNVPNSSRNLEYDANGNMTSDGTNTYQWDAANRLVVINEPNNHTTQFAYDGLNRRVQIVETNSNSVTSTKNLVWCGYEICEERDANNNVTKRYYPQGMQLSGTSYYYNRDHLGSVRELTDGTGAIRARYDYSPYGQATKVSGDLDADFQYAGMYYHQPTGLNLTWGRFYNPTFGRWISRDPFANAEIRLGSNLYEYVSNNPISLYDPYGLSGNSTLGYGSITGPGGTTSGIMNTSQVINTLNSAAPNSVTDVTLTGHGSSDPDMIQLADGSFFTTGLGPTANSPTILDENGNDVTDVFRRALAPGATIHLNGCHTAKGDNSLAQNFSLALNTGVTGYLGFGFGLNGFGLSIGLPITFGTR